MVVAGGGKGRSVAPIPRCAAEQNFYGTPTLKTLRRLRGWLPFTGGGEGGGFSFVACFNFRI